MDELIDSFKRMEIKMANIEQGKINNRGYNNNNGVRGRCYNCNRTGHIARDCRMQRNFGQNGIDIVCNTCGRIGHMEQDCYRNKTYQKCGRKGHTREVCRSTISRVNYVEEWDYNDNYGYEDEEVYVTTRSGKKTHIPEFAKRLQEQGHQKPKPVVIQKGQVYEEKPKRQQPRKIVQGRKKMDVEEEGEYGIKEQEEVHK
jgi:hypothetical protein